MSTTNVTLEFESSQPLTEQQLKYLTEQLDKALETLPGVDKEDFLDIPEYTIASIISQQPL